MFEYLTESLDHVVYPPVCYLCGKALQGNYICPFCLRDKFEDPNPFGFSSCNGVILPEEIRFQDALWLFEKYTSVQEVLHGLKYGGMTGMGLQIGRLLGERLLGHPLFSLKDVDNYRILPVPLHRLRLLRRGYNQAYLIARGISLQTGIPLLSGDAVIRKKYTQSQTGFSLDRRLNNVRNAFEVRQEKEIADKRLIITDDVFTTGATSFELSGVCRNVGADSVIILTVAQA